MQLGRRRLLRTVAGASIGTAGVGTVSAEGGGAEVDPRPVGREGEAPDPHVPTASVGALPGENTTPAAGQWVSHDNGWVSFQPPDGNVTGCPLVEFLDETLQVFTIDGDEFVLSGADDWDLRDPSPAPDEVCAARFQFVTPPKPVGTSYEMRWEAFGDASKYPALDLFPVSNRIEVVRRNG